MAKARKTAEEKLADDIAIVESIQPIAKRLVEMSTEFVDANPPKHASLVADMRIVLNASVKALCVLETMLGYESSMGKSVQQAESALKKGANDE